MTECGICGNHQRKLYCGGCATHLVLRARINVLNVTNQLSAFQTSVSNILEGLPSDAETTQVQGGRSGNKAQISQLNAQIDILQRRLDEIRRATAKTKQRSSELAREKETISEAVALTQHTSKDISKSAQSQYRAFELDRSNKESQLEQGYKDMLHFSLGLQSKCCQELIEIFALKKKRKKVGYEIVLGFNIIPDLTQLGHYSVITINSGIERIATFAMLLASYLGIRLPYELILPRKSQPNVLIGTTKEPIWLPHSVKTMMRSSTREFHHFCELLAMLALNVTHIALKLGIPGINDLEDIAKINQMVAQIYLRIEGLIKSGSQITIYSGNLQADIESVQDHLITAIDIEMNGKSAEWNIVEVPSPT